MNQQEIQKIVQRIDVLSRSVADNLDRLQAATDPDWIDELNAEISAARREIAQLKKKLAEATRQEAQEHGSAQ